MTSSGPLAARLFALAVPILLFAPAVALGALATVGIWVGVVAPLTAAGTATYLREGSPTGRGWAIAPALAGLVAVTVLAPRTFGAELLGALAALSVLAWLAWPATGLPTRRTGDSLVFPGVCVAIAIASSLLVVAGQSLVGLVAAILVGVLLLVGWLFENPSAFRDRTAT